MTQDDAASRRLAGRGAVIAIDPSQDPRRAEQLRMVEALLFASSAPMSLAALGERLPQNAPVDVLIAQLQRLYEGRGVNLVAVAGGWAFRTAPDLAFLMRAQAVETRPLGRAAMETLAIVAYHQPVTRTEIEDIRGVGVSRGTLDTLMELGWVRFGRRRDTPGRPATFVTTDGFLDHFDLSTAKDLPGLEDLRATGLLQPRADAAAPETGDLFDEPGGTDARDE